MANKFREKLAGKRSKKGYDIIAKENHLLQLLSDIPDHRKGQGKLHKLEHILFLSVIAQLMGAVNYKEIWVWITKYIQNEKIKKLLGVEFIRTPSRSAVAEILAEADYIELERVFRIWINQLVDTSNSPQLAVDGKVMNGSSVNAQKSTEVLNAVLADTGIILAHKKITDKSNEVPALRELIDELDDSFIYSFDAMNCKKNAE
ncbi:MAG: ISAs1 family transposase [Flavobacteriales bacterium]|nr:ISAs1 family transposase [Flavobacteriales bacterium]